MNIEKPPTNEHNPYTPPSTQNIDYDHDYNDNHFGLLNEARSCGAGRGLTWLTYAFKIFARNWLMWIATGIIYMVIAIVLAMSPLSIIMNLIIFHFVGSFMLICATREEGEDFSFIDMFSAFQSHFVPLLVLGLIYSVSTIVVMIPAIVIIIPTVMKEVYSGGDIPSIQQFMTSGSFSIILIGVLISLALFIRLLMSIYLAPALIVLHDIAPVKAMKMSLNGCIKNLLPFLIFGLVMLIIMQLLVVFTFGIGMIIAIPVFLISYYTCYRDIWTQEMLGENE